MKLITSANSGQSGSNSGLTAQQRQLLSEFDAIDADCQRYVLAVLHGEYERFMRSMRPNLRLIAAAAA